MKIPPALMTAGKIAGAFSAIIGVWFTLESRLDDLLRDHTSTIVEAHISDLRNREIMQDFEISAIENEGEHVPDYMKLNKELLGKQIEELKEWGE